MDAVTKLFIALLVLFAAGVGLIAIGLGATTKLAALGVGIALSLAAVTGLRSLWRGGNSQ